VLLGYNTNGFAHHRLKDALHILADLGYQSIALTLDHHSLNPFDPDMAQHLASTKEIMHQRGLRCVIETGARFLLDPWRKHQPTLVSPTSNECMRRLDFLCRAVDIAVDIARELSADAVSFWSGAATDGAPEAVWMERLVDGCLRLSDWAAAAGVRLAFEPEPGMAVDSMARYAALYSRVNHPAFGLTLDIGHLHCLGEFPIVEHLRRWRNVLWNVHIEDMRQGIHEHLPFGEGEIDIGEVLSVLRKIGFSGGVHVELSRHSHDAVETARRSLAFLRARI
jgi:sugar phosphate isomerase/epimerase